MLAALAAASMLAGGAAIAADAPEASLLQQVKDRADIEALMWRYVRALDTMNADAYASVYTEDGSFGSGANQTKGRAALHKMVVDLKKARDEREARGEPKSPPMYHTILNHTIEFRDPDHATVHSYWATMFGPAKQGETPRVAAVGRGVDELVRVNGQWLIKSRDVAPQD